MSTPAGVSTSHAPQSTCLTAALAVHCQRPVTDAALEKAALHLADWIGCAAIGAAQAEAAALSEGFTLPNSSTIEPEQDMPSDPWSKLLFQAAVGNLLEMDDLYKPGLVHPGPVVIPAALFMAQRIGADGRALLEAIVRGYEAMNCLGRSVGAAHYRYWHNTATCGPTGAAAAACALMQLSTEQWVHAFGHAITQSAGLWQVRLEPGLAKQWHNARAAQTGVQAALLARAGAAAPQRILEGEKGFYAAMCADAAPESLLSDDWQILYTSLKPWAACRHSHAAIDGALELHQQLVQLAEPVSRIRSIHVRTYADALSFCDEPEPRTPIQARFSLQHAAAVTLLHGPPALAAFDDSGLSDPAVQALRRKVSVALHPELDAVYPSRFGAEVAIQLDNGQALRSLRRDAWGDPEHPMDAAAVGGKASMLLETATPGRADPNLIEFAMQLHAKQVGVEALRNWLTGVTALIKHS